MRPEEMNLLANRDLKFASVLFELIAERYERRSILITANQPFSGWDTVFPDAGMTVAAIDRLAHHSTIFEGACMRRASCSEEISVSLTIWRCMI